MKFPIFALLAFSVAAHGQSTAPASQNQSAPGAAAEGAKAGAAASSREEKVTAEKAKAEKAAEPRLVPVNLFAVPEGLEVTVWATTPMLYNPTNIDFDKDGRLWVAEGVRYRGKAKRRPEGDRIVVLQDTDGDGAADKSDVFVQEEDLLSPLGIAVMDNKVVVSQPPDLLVYTDVNRDGKFDSTIDTRERLLTGFNGRNHDHSLHSVTAGPDGQWYFNQGNTGALFTDNSGKTFRMGSSYVHANGKQVVDPSTIAGQKSDDGHVWIGGFTARMNPDGTGVTIVGHNYRNSYEQTVNSLGDIYQSDNDDPPACRVTPILEGGNAGFSSRDGKRSWNADKRPGQDTPTAEWRQEDPGTMPAGDVYGGGSPTGVAFYENGALGEKWRGLLLTCEAGRNVVFGYLPKPDGAGFKLERFDFLDSNKEKEFTGSDFLHGKGPKAELKHLFRPSDVAVGPDGAIYVADWFDARVGGHGTMDDTMSGTIYRIAPIGFRSKVPKIDLATTEGQIEALKSPAVNVRNSGFTRLKAQGEKAVPAVAQLLGDANPYLAARATWLLAQMGPAGVARVKPLLAAEDETKRLVAYRALRRAEVDVLSMAAKMAGDHSAAIRREVALTMREVPVGPSRAILEQIATQFDGKDRTYLEALGLGCEGKEREIYADLAKSMTRTPEEWPDSFAWIAWRLGSPDAVADLKARALSTKVSDPQRKLAMDAIAFIRTADAANAMVELAANTDFPLHEDALWWLNSRRGNEWKEHGLLAVMKQRGLVKEKPLVSAISPEPPATSTMPPMAEILALNGDPVAGKASIAVCYSCHKVGKEGLEFGPELTQFGKTQTREVIINAILKPSAEISHGFEGTRIETTDGLTIDGIAIGEGDPVMIKSVGGLAQNVPRERIKTMAPLGRSLMFPPELLGITPQMIVDIVAYLQAGP